jgi:ubiquinol-cytochrome c reductase cytochrome b subunit
MLGRRVGPRRSVSDRLFERFTRRTAPGRWLARAAERQRHRVVPNHWSNLLGVVSLASVVVLFATGLFLMFFFAPTSQSVAYDGAYAPLRGARMSGALASTLHLSFDVRGGLLVRQVHHWAALLLPASLVLQLLTTFFTGGFRRPREWSWVTLLLLLVVALVGGWSGYGLPDDLLSGTGLRIAQGVAVSVPVVGTWASWLLFGGEFPGEVIAHLYPLHVAVVPAALVGLLVVRIAIGYRHGPPQFAGPGRTEENVVGVPLLPTAAARATGLFAIVAGLLVALGAAVRIDPVWLYGPASPGDATAGSQPDWYTGFLDGALRLVPPGWEVVWLEKTWTLAVLVPLAVVSAFLALVAAYPFVERWITGDDREHHLLDRPRNVPGRTAIGVAGVVFAGILWAAGSGDLIATAFHLSIEGVVVTLRVALLGGPVLGFLVTRRICVALQRRDRDVLLHGYETGRVVRLPGGRYAEVRRPLDAGARWRIVDVPERRLVEVRPDRNGSIRPTLRLRALLSRRLFADSAVPIRAADASPTTTPQRQSA